MRRHRTGLIGSLVIAGLVAAACAGGDDDDGADEPAAAEEPAAGTDDAADDEPGDEPADEPPEATTVAPLEDEDQLTSVGEGGSLPVIDDAVAGGEITWGLDNDGTGFDTRSAIAPGSIRIITAMVDALVGLDADANWYPNLAEALTPNDDFTVWTITLRPDIVFHDGEPVNASAVTANLRAFKNSPTTGFSFAAVEEIEAVDDLTVAVTMNRPWAAFPYHLVTQAGWMVSPFTIGVNDKFVSTGPFMLDTWTPGDSARVVRNPNYWRADEGLPFLDAINFKVLPDQAVRRQAFDAGDVDGFISPADTDILEWLDDDAVDVWIGTAGANEFLLMLNTAVAPLDDLRVRRALAHAIDRQFLIDTFRSGLTVPADGPFNPASKWYSQTDAPDFDPAAAQALVDEYEAEVGPVEFELKVQPTPSTIEIAEVAISFLTDVGIDVTLTEIGPGQSALVGIADDFQAITWAQFGAPDPDRDYHFFHSSGGLLNWSNLVSAEIDAGLDQARESADFETRYEGYARFQQALADELPIIWIDHLNGVEAAVTRPELNGIGTPGLLRDGTPSLAMTDGSFFSWSQVWLEQ